MDKNRSYIGERILSILEDPEASITVRLGNPRQNTETNAFECEYQILGNGLNIDRVIVGFDGIQAVQCALRVIGAEIIRIEKKLGIHLRFGDVEDSGFPFD